MSGSGFLIEREAWMKLAHCRDKPKEMFILGKGQSASEAKAICRTCPVKDPCLEYGMRTRSVGVWGGRVLAWKEETVELYPVRPLPDTVFEQISESDLPSILGSTVLRPYQELPSILGDIPLKKAVNGP